jgi:hypothetical protein
MKIMAKSAITTSAYIMMMFSPYTGRTPYDSFPATDTLTA